MTDALGLGFATEETARQRWRTFEEPEWLLEERLDAIRRYAELPPETNQLFITYLDLRAARFGEIEPYAVTGDGPSVDTTLPDGAAALLAIEDDAAVARALSPEARHAGVVVDTFASVLRSRSQSLQGLLEGGRTLPVNDKFAQLARATASVGVFVHVPDGVELDEPIVLRWSVGKPGRGLVGRTVVALGREAHATVLEEQVAAVSSANEEHGSSGGDGRQSLWAGTMEVVLAEGATLDVAAEQNFGPNTVSFVNRHATVQRDATLRWAIASVGGTLIKSRIDNLLAGRGAAVKQVEIGFGGGSQLFDLTSYTRHIATDTTGDLLSKGVFQDRSRGYFKGLIEIQKTAKGTDSFLGEFAMLLTKRARSVAIPSLEIDQPDVRRASHSSSVGPIDEAQLFYLMSRGLPRDVARKVIVLGFLEPVVARIPLPGAQERLRALLDRKWESGTTPAAARAA
ncbi:MAG: SufD family Fe-S cluster assembly protein [Chloroflexota bacterium]|nr:SufD family Fe-S cluster assembly protein [Chloroflexota bacterium]